MKSKILYIFLFIILNNLVLFNVKSSEQFNFDVTEIEILENGNLIKGLKKVLLKQMMESKSQQILLSMTKFQIF